MVGGGRAIIHSFQHWPGAEIMQHQSYRLERPRTRFPVSGPEPPRLADRFAFHVRLHVAPWPSTLSLSCGFGALADGHRARLVVV